MMYLGPFAPESERNRSLLIEIIMFCLIVRVPVKAGSALEAVAVAYALSAGRPNWSKKK
jgi:hypothetical protein